MQTTCHLLLPLVGGTQVKWRSCGTATVGPPVTGEIHRYSRVWADSADCGGPMVWFTVGQLHVCLQILGGRDLLQTITFHISLAKQSHFITKAAVLLQWWHGGIKTGCRLHHMAEQQINETESQIHEWQGSSVFKMLRSSPHGSSMVSSGLISVEFIVVTPLYYFCGVCYIFRGSLGHLLVFEMWGKRYLWQLYYFETHFSLQFCRRVKALSHKIRIKTK